MLEGTNRLTPMQVLQSSTMETVPAETPGTLNPGTDVVRYYHTDAIGSVRVITDASGSVVERHDYKPFGEEWSGGSGAATKRFTGQERDQESGLEYFAARYLETELGRFIRPDDPGYGHPFDPQSMNLYAYARNNPLRFVDPSGHEPCPTRIDDSYTCVEGRAGTGELAYDLTAWMLRDLIRAWGQLNEPPPGVSGAPLGPPAWGIGRSLMGTSAVRFGPLARGPLPAAVANTFRSGSYTSKTLNSSTTLYRVYGGTASQLGSFWTRTPPRGSMQAAMDLGLNPQWGNTATRVVKIQVPAGTTVYEGVAAAQGGLLGGGNQIFIPLVSPSWIIR